VEFFSLLCFVKQQTKLSSAMYFEHRILRRAAIFKCLTK
jgi:hypothetical protein